MIIGIDNISPGISTTATGLGGMRLYVRDLAECLPDANPEAQFKLFAPVWNADLLEKPPKNLKIVKCTGVPLTRPGRVVYEQVVLPVLIARHRIGLWIGTHNILPVVAPCKCLLINQSLQYCTQPDSYRQIRRNYLKILGLLSTWRADRIVALSEHAREQILTHLRASSAKVEVIYNRLPKVALSHDPRLAEHCSNEMPAWLRDGDRFVLSVSALYRYKNYARLIAAFAQVVREVPRVRLVIVGGDTAELTREDLLAIARGFGIADRCHITGRVTDSLLYTFYRNAALMALPTLDETFGLTVLEAMAFGCPVVTSNCGSVAEIGGTAIEPVNPLDVCDIAGGVLRVLKDSSLSSTLRSRGLARQAHFTRERMISQFTDLIRSIQRSPRLFGRPQRPQTDTASDTLS